MPTNQGIWPGEGIPGWSREAYRAGYPLLVPSWEARMAHISSFWTHLGGYNGAYSSFLDPSGRLE